jgi:hypothetical protein
MKKFPARHPAWGFKRAMFSFLLAAAHLLADHPLGAQTVTATISVRTDPSRMAINPITNKIHVVTSKGDITEIDGRRNSTTVVPSVGGPNRLMVIPNTNRFA